MINFRRISELDEQSEGRLLLEYESLVLYTKHFQPNDIVKLFNEDLANTPYRVIANNNKGFTVVDTHFNVIEDGKHFDTPGQVVLFILSRHTVDTNIAIDKHKAEQALIELDAEINAEDDDDFDDDFADESESKFIPIPDDQKPKEKPSSWKGWAIFAGALFLMLIFNLGHDVGVKRATQSIQDKLQGYEITPKRNYLDVLKEELEEAKRIAMENAAKRQQEAIEPMDTEVEAMEPMELAEHLELEDDPFVENEHWSKFWNEDGTPKEAVSSHKDEITY